MKTFQPKRTILAVAALLTMAFQANAQHGYISDNGLKNVIGEYYEQIDPSDPSKGYILNTDMGDTFGKTTRVRGIDNLAVGQLDGEHWNGYRLPTGEDLESVYLVNKKTGEYLELGAAWGATPMLGYVGSMFNLRGGKYCKADEKGKEGGVLADYQVAGNDPSLGNKAEREGKGYEIRYSWDEAQCVGRKQTAKGQKSTFEELPYLVNRKTHRKEYVLNPDDSGQNGNEDGKFIFYFHPVRKGEKLYYVIYTHRQTTAPVHESYFANTNMNKFEEWQRLSEYGNRDSYLCLKAEPDPVTETNIAIYKKFAGRMYNAGTSKTHAWYEYYARSNSDAWRNPTSSSAVEVDDNYAWPVGPDETAFKIQQDDAGKTEECDIDLAAGLAAVQDDDACLWKIVTRKERDGYRVAASIDHPYDLSYLINNPNFLCQFGPYSTGGSNGTPNFGWNWYDGATATTTHEHPYTAGPGTEFHKIGTHFYDRWGWGDTEDGYLGGKEKEQIMTQGEESDFVGSIYNGSAALRQTITGLRPGRYIVYCQAFYAPLEMKNFDNANDFNQANYTPDGTLLPYTYNGAPTWQGAAVPSDVQALIDGQEMSNTSFLFAISKPEGSADIIRKRRLPSIFSGMIPLDTDHIDGLTKDEYANLFNGESTFTYTPLGDFLYTNSKFVEWTDENGEVFYMLDDISPALLKPNNIGTKHPAGHQYELLLDKTVFGKVSYGGATHFVPRNLAGAARFFSAYDQTKHANALNYRIGLPVEVGEDGELTIGVENQANGSQTEWVCFDNFELVYYGNTEEWEFVIDESSPENCTRYHDLFDWEKTGDVAVDRRAKVIIKRGLDPEKFVPIVLPISLTKAQAKEAFGDGVKISEPGSISYNTIHFTAVGTDGEQSEIAMHAGRPYIVKPSIAAPVSATQTWERTGKDHNPFDWSTYQQGVYQNQRQYVPKPGRNNQIVKEIGGLKKTVNGPIYFLDGYRIDKQMHYQYPLPTNADNHFTGNNPDNNKFDYTKPWYNASYQWNAVGDMYVGDELMQIKGSTDGKQYQLRATCYYDAPGYREERVPAYSYFFKDGNLKFNGADGSTQQKGFSFYLQIVESEPLDTVQITNQFAKNVGPHLNSWDGATSSVTSNAASGVAGVTISVKDASNNSYNGIDKANGTYFRSLTMQPAAANSTTTITITPPSGYKIDGYKIGGYCWDKTKETYTLTAEGGESISITENESASGPSSYLEKKRLDLDNMTVTLSNTTTNGTSNVKLSTFIVYLRPVSSSGSAKVFAGNVGDFEWVPAVDDEVTGVTETFREWENPANDLYYDLMGRPVKTPRKNGIYIYHGKKIVY